MTSGYLGLLMLGLIVVAIMMGFPTAFTLMGLGMLFGYIAYFDPAQSMVGNHVFDLMVQRTYGGMTNDTLLSIPLFVLMGYVIERAALVDKMFKAVQLSFRRLPASLAVATLLVCTFWGIASGIVGAVVVLMGVIAMRPMLKAGYDTRLAAGVITAGGTLGILIPPSVMIIVYAAVAGQSVVKLYAAAMVPGFFLAFLYFVYVVGWAIIDPLVSLVSVVVIVLGTWGLLKDSAGLAMDGTPSSVKLDVLRAELCGLPGVREVHDLHVWGLSTTETALTAHLVHDRVDADVLLAEARAIARRHGIGHSTLQLEPQTLPDCPRC
jgi:cation diffusion facilitator family transporter